MPAKLIITMTIQSWTAFDRVSTKAIFDWNECLNLVDFVREATYGKGLAIIARCQLVAGWYEGL